MLLRQTPFWIVVFGALFALTGVLVPAAEAWTRFVYLGANNQMITAGSMDWKADVGANLWVFPRDMQRSGQAGPNSFNGHRNMAA